MYLLKVKTEIDKINRNFAKIPFTKVLRLTFILFIFEFTKNYLIMKSFRGFSYNK